MAADSRKTQRARILRLLLEARGAWVPLPDIMACAAQYNARIFELRKQGFDIENRTEVVDDVQHSWFRLVPSSSQKSPRGVKPYPPKPSSESDYMRRLREEQARAMPLFAGTVHR
ncbi:MAG TPA: hypothetical protein VFN26_08380 [Candidatus Acidoferrum sp.]|nr:hypothetical protein [Candidatus Acidoferrum sp.]